MLPPTVIRTCPSADNDFQPLSEYQEQTPDTFFDGKPVLYYHDENVKAWVSAEQHDQLFFFSKTPEDGGAPLNPSPSPNPTPPECYALENNWGKHIREEKVEAFVTSNKLILFSHQTGTGIEIPYPAITLHAVKSFEHVDKPEDSSTRFIGVYMQLEFARSGDDDDEMSGPIELTLIPFKKQDSTGTPIVDPLNTERTTALFNQISACSNLHPDPEEDEEEDEEQEAFDRIVFEGDAIEGLPGVFQGEANGGLPPPMPGSSGWITADNVQEYFDEEGNWIGPDGVSGELGDGAGHVRGHDEMVGDDSNGVEDGDDNDTKRPRNE